MANSLYHKTSTSAGNTLWSSDINQFVGALAGTSDPGPISWAAATAAPGTAPGYTLASGGVTVAARQYAAYWITGGSVDGSGTAHITGRTLCGVATSAVALSSQQAVCTAPASPPSTAIGWGLCATHDGGTTFYRVGESTMSYAGAWSSITDDLADSALTTLAPSANTTGTPVTFGAGATIPTGQTLAMDGAYISGAPTLTNGLGIGNGQAIAAPGGGKLFLGLEGATWFVEPGGSDAEAFVVNDFAGTNILIVGASGTDAVATLNNTLDDGTGGTIWSGKMALTSAGYLCWDAAMSTLPTSIGMGLIDPSVLGWGDGLLLNGAPFGTTAAVYANVDTGSSTRGLSLGDQEGSVWWADADGNQQMGGQLRSTLATGTAPLAVASTTMVDYLNAEFWGGAANNVQASIGSAGSPSPTSTGVGTSITCSGSLVILIGQGAAGLEATDAGSLYIMQSTYGIPGSGDAPHSGDTAVAVASASSNMGTSSVSVPLTPIGWATGLTNGTTYYFYLAYTQTGATMTGSSILAIQH